MARLIFFIFIFYAAYAKAEEPQIRVIALFKNAAMVEFNGQKKLYRSGQSLSNDIKLIGANGKFATFDISGKRVELSLNSHVNFENTQPAQSNDEPNGSGGNSVQILRNLQGMYETPGYINGFSVHFLVDTGATTIAMNEKVAKRLGIPYRMEGTRGRGSTASGIVNTWKISLKKVRVGTIELSHVEAVVIQGTGPNEVLLGQSFLNRLKVETEGRLLRLTKKF